MTGFSTRPPRGGRGQSTLGLAAVLCMAVLALMPYISRSAIAPDSQKLPADADSPEVLPGVLPGVLAALAPAPSSPLISASTSNPVAERFGSPIQIQTGSMEGLARGRAGSHSSVGSF